MARVRRTPFGLSRILLAAVGILLSTRGAYAQTEFSGLPEPGEPVFDLDMATFRASGDSVALELYYRILNPHLSYVRKGGQYVASYEISAVLKSGGDQQAASAGNTENYTLATFDETRRASGYLVNVLRMRILPGQYGLSVTVNDRISGGTHTIRRSVDLKDREATDWVIGGPEFILPGAAAPGYARYRKDTASLVPNVTRSFGGADIPLSLYFEIYPTVDHPVASVVIRASQQTGKHHFEDTIRVESSSEVIPIHYQTPLKEFEGGEARLEITALDSNGHRIGSPALATFSIDWSLASMIESNWKDVVDMLVHIASHAEMDSLSKTPPEGRARAFDRFWKSKDPSPETEENEWKEEYYRRIRFANQQFTTPFSPGWRTDFGTVYIKYGEPDEVERFPFEIDSKPYEIWHYYAQRRQFVFVDMRGNGSYELQYPYDGIVH
jgi:GWxTD domain-containing protein